MTYSEFLFWKHYILQKLKELGLPEFVEVSFGQSLDRLFEYKLMINVGNKKWGLVQVIPRSELRIKYRWITDSHLYTSVFICRKALDGINHD